MYNTLYALLNKSENATLQYFIFCEKVLEEKYLLKINNVFQTSSKRFVETPPICLFDVWARETKFNFSVSQLHKLVRHGKNILQNTQRDCDCKWC